MVSGKIIDIIYSNDEDYYVWNTDAANFAWYIWLIIALGFSIAVILLGASFFYIIHSCRK